MSYTIKLKRFPQISNIRYDLAYTRGLKLGKKHILLLKIIIMYLVLAIKRDQFQWSPTGLTRLMKKISTRFLTIGFRFWFDILLVDIKTWRRNTFYHRKLLLSCFIRHNTKGPISIFAHGTYIHLRHRFHNSNWNWFRAVSDRQWHIL